MKRLIVLIPLLAILMLSFFFASEKDDKEHGIIELKEIKLPYIIGGYEWVSENQIFYVEKAKSRYVPTLHNVLNGDKRAFPGTATNLIPEPGVFSWRLVSNRTTVIISTLKLNEERAIYLLNVARGEVTEYERAPPGDFYQTVPGALWTVERTQGEFVFRSLQSQQVLELPATGSALGFDNKEHFVTARIEDSGKEIVLVLDLLSLTGGAIQSRRISIPDNRDFSEVSLSHDGSFLLFKTEQLETIFGFRRFAIWKMDLNSGQLKSVCRRDQMEKAYWVRENTDFVSYLDKRDARILGRIRF